MRMLIFWLLVAFGYPSAAEVPPTTIVPDYTCPTLSEKLDAFKFYFEGERLGQNEVFEADWSLHTVTKINPAEVRIDLDPLDGGQMEVSKNFDEGHPYVIFVEGVKYFEICAFLQRITSGEVSAA